MNVELITKQDLEQFKKELFEELKQGSKPSAQTPPQWLKSKDVRKLLGIAPGTLQNLRINGTLGFTKVGSILYYKMEDINRLLEKGSTKEGRK